MIKHSIKNLFIKILKKKYDKCNRFFLQCILFSSYLRYPLCIIANQQASTVL
jgi:hypothetical protein